MSAYTSAQKGRNAFASHSAIPTSPQREVETQTQTHTHTNTNTHTHTAGGTDAVNVVTTAECW